MGEARLRWRKEHTAWRQEEPVIACPEELDPVVEGNLALEVTLIVLDSMELVVETLSQSETLQCVLGLVLRLLLQGLSLTQCVTAAQHLLASQRSLVMKVRQLRVTLCPFLTLIHLPPSLPLSPPQFPDFVFEEETEQCGNLCLHLLRHCSSSLQEIRSHAAASLYMLMRHNFELGNVSAIRRFCCESLGVALCSTGQESMQRCNVSFGVVVFV